MEKLTSQKGLSFLTALLYAVHPINGFIVNYVTASVIATYVLFAQGSFWYFMKFCDSKNKIYGALSFCFFVLASLSHEMTVILPVFFLAYLFFMKREHFKSLALSLLPFIGYLLIWFLLRAQETAFKVRLHHLNSLEKTSAFAYLTSWINLVRWHIEKLFFPQDIIFLWSHKCSTGHFGANYMFLAAFLAAFIFFLLKWKQGWKPFMLSVFAAGYLPSFLSAFVYYPHDWPLIEPHWFYFSEIGFFSLLGLGIITVIQKHRWTGGLLMSGIIAFALILSWQTNAKWKDQMTYSRYWLAVNPGNLTPFYWLGRSYMDQGDFQSAAKIFEKGYTSLHCLSYNLAADWGHSLDLLGDPSIKVNDHLLGDQSVKAKDLLYTAKLLDPEYAQTRYYIGIYFLKHNRPDLAAQAFAIARQLDPALESPLWRPKNE
jgi:tetratricopeptide (TPR) repeat protein